MYFLIMFSAKVIFVIMLDLQYHYVNVCILSTLLELFVLTKSSETFAISIYFLLAPTVFKTSWSPTPINITIDHGKCKLLCLKTNKEDNHLHTYLKAFTRKADVVLDNLHVKYTVECGPNFSIFLPFSV